MPDVRLSGDFLGFKAGETVDLSNDEYSDALHACVVGKTYRSPVVGVERREHAEPEGRDLSDSVSLVPADADPERPAQESFKRPTA